MTLGTIARHHDSGGNYVGPLKRAALVKINPRLAGGTYAWPMDEKHPPRGARVRAAQFSPRDR